MTELFPNRSTAVMARRTASLAGLDYYPTPEWATEALFQFIDTDRRIDTCLEPAAGGGHMVDVLADHFWQVRASDIADPEQRGWGGQDFLLEPAPPCKFDWLITNPPFKLAEKFILRAPKFAFRFAFLARLSLLEGQGRFRNLWQVMPPTQVAVFTRRVTMVEGRLADPSVSSATCYAWFIWGNGWQLGHPPELTWIP